MLQFEKIGTGNLGAGDLSNRYLWGPAVDQLLADEQVDWSNQMADGEVLWALTDHLGTVRDVVDSNGELRIHRRFDSFGNVVGETHYDASGANVSVGQAGYVDTVFAFTGKLFDDATGLQNNLNRWYDPSTGRWLSEDPIGFNAGDENLYRYVGNAPTNYTDPTGLIPPLVVIGIGIGAFWGAMSSPNIANAPAPGDAVFPDPGLCGCEPQNALIGAGLGAAGGGAATGIGGLIGGGGAVVGGPGAWSAVVTPHLPAGTYPALGYGSAGGTVFISRGHIVCQQMARKAGFSGNATHYGMAIIDEAGNFVGWAFGTGPK